MEEQQIKDVVFAKYKHILLTLMSLLEQETFETLFQSVEQLQAENKELRACHESELGVCQQHCDIVKNLEAEKEKFKKLLGQKGSEIRDLNNYISKYTVD